MQGKVSHVVQTQHGALLNTDRDFLHPWLFSLISLCYTHLPLSPSPHLSLLLSLSLYLFASPHVFLSPLPLSLSLSNDVFLVMGCLLTLSLSFLTSPSHT